MAVSRWPACGLHKRAPSVRMQQAIVAYRGGKHRREEGMGGQETLPTPEINGCRS